MPASAVVATSPVKTREGEKRRRREGERESVGWEPSKEDREFNHREVPTDGHVECERAGGSSSCVCGTSSSM